MKVKWIKIEKKKEKGQIENSLQPIHSPWVFIRAVVVDALKKHKIIWLIFKIKYCD